MNFVVCNYASENSTEPYYLNASINLLPNCKSVFWNPSDCSLYDILDYSGADVFICSASHIPSDIINYVQENKRPQLVLNITNLDTDIVKKILGYLSDAGVTCEFLFTNIATKTNEISGVNVVYIPYSADVFLSKDEDLKFDIEACYLTNKDISIESKFDTYHIISNNQAHNKADVMLPLINMGQVYGKYRNIVFTYFDGFLPQIFFDAVYYGKNVYYELNDSNKQKEAEELVKRVLKLENTNNFTEIKNVVQDKHTCLNRVKTLLSQLPCQESIKTIDDLIETCKQRTNS